MRGVFYILNEQYAVKIRALSNVWHEERLEYAKEKYPEYTARIPFYYRASSWIAIRTTYYVYIYGILEPFGMLTFGGSYKAELDQNDLPYLSDIDDLSEQKTEDIWLLLGLPKPIMQSSFSLLNDSPPENLHDEITDHARSWVEEQVTALIQEDKWIEVIRRIDNKRKTQLYNEIHEAFTCHKYGLKIAAISVACTALETACLIALEENLNMTANDLKREKLLYINDYLKYLESNGVISERSCINGQAVSMVRRTTAHSKTGELKDYTAIFVLEAVRDIVFELL